MLDNRYYRYQVESDGCWNWKGARDSNDYGVIWHQGKLNRIHVVFWEEIHGPVPKGYELHHKCKNPSCANPDHVEPLTRSEHLLLEPTHLVRTKHVVEQVKYLRDELGLDFITIGLALGIGKTTAHRAYHNLHKTGATLKAKKISLGG
jgi:hypothetical protein